MNKNGESLLVAIFLVGLSVGAIPASSVQAEEDCLAAPNGPPPPGSQWRYRTDQIKQRKCWHLQPVGEKSETGTATTRPAAERPKSPPDHLEDKKAETTPEATPKSRGSTAPASVQDSGAGRLAPSAWPAAAPAAPDNTAWPDPPTPAYAGKVPPAPPAPVAVDNAEEPQAPKADRNLGSDAWSETKDAAAAPISDDKMSLGIILISAAALVIVGFLVVRWVSRRSRIASAPYVQRRRDIVASEIADDGPHDEQQALQKLLQVLQQRDQISAGRAVQNRRSG
jgi:hypothetical protein